MHGSPSHSVSWAPSLFFPWDSLCIAVPYSVHPYSVHPCFMYSRIPSFCSSFRRITLYMVRKPCPSPRVALAFPLVLLFPTFLSSLSYDAPSAQVVVRSRPVYYAYTAYMCSAGRIADGMVIRRSLFFFLAPKLCPPFFTCLFSFLLSIPFRDAP